MLSDFKKNFLSLCNECVKNGRRDSMLLNRTPEERNAETMSSMKDVFRASDNKLQCVSESVASLIDKLDKVSEAVSVLKTQVSQTMEQQPVPQATASLPIRH